MALHAALESEQILFAHLVQVDGGEHHHLQPQFLAIQQGDPSINHAGLLQLVHPAPTGGLGEMDLRGEISGGNSGIALQRPQNLDINFL